MQQRMEALQQASDSDGDGKLSKTEFQAMLDSQPQSAGAPALNVDDVFEKADTDGDNLLSFEELQASRPEPPPMMTYMSLDPEAIAQEFEAQFEAADEDGDGMLNESEFAVLINSMPGSGEQAPDIDAMFAETDTDGDGLVSLSDIESARPAPPPPPPGGGGGGSMESLSELLNEEDEESDLFSYLDADGDGNVDLEEIQQNYELVRSYMEMQITSYEDTSELDLLGR